MELKTQVRRNNNNSGFKSVPRGINNSLRRKQRKIGVQQKQLLTVIKCDCGNQIRMFNEKKEVKCFKCNHYHFKLNGKWEKQPHVITKDTMTLGDIVVKIRNKR